MFSTIKKNYEFYKKQYFRGNDIFCPFCTGSYKAERFKLSKELSMNCPICSSTVEERTVLLFLQAKTGLLSGELKVLVVTEPGKIPDYFANFPNAEVKVYNETGDFTIRDNTLKNKYPSDSFDLIVCNYILEKLPDYIPVLKEMNRTLKPDGLIMLQANIDPEKDKTAEYPITSYKDRFLMYGIPGNHRRFGKDYAELVRSQGLKVSRLKFTEGFEGLPELSFNKNEVIFIAHKSETPLLTDNMDDLEREMDEQRSNYGGSSFSSLLYTLFFILPELSKKYLLSFLGNLSEKEDNKGTFIYMTYVLIMGLAGYWGALFFFVLLTRLSMVYWFVGTPVLLIFGFGGAAILSGYVFLNDRASLFKKTVVAAFLFVSLWLPFVGGFLK
jgi:SAM-dependent methyltransferase